MKSKIFYTLAERRGEIRKRGNIYLDYADVKSAVKDAKAVLAEGESQVLFKVTISPVRKLTKTKVVKDLKNV